MNYRYSNPTQIVFGVGVINEIAEKVKQVNGSKALVVTDQGVVQSGALEAITKNLDDGAIEYYIFDQIQSDPSIEMIHEIHGIATTQQCDCVIAIGGGSPIDASKGVSLLMTNGGSLREYGGINKVKKKGLPLIAVPTTSGTGSEVTFFSVITDQQANQKFTICSPLIAVDIALLDPQLTTTMPPSVTASTGFDALCHAIEGYTSLGAEPITNALAIEAIRLIGKNISDAVNHDSCLKARVNMMQGALMAGMAFHNSFLGLGHALGSPIGAILHVPHGVAVGVMLPYVMKYNRVVCPDRFAEVADALGVKPVGNDLYEQAGCAVAAVHDLLERCHMPRKLRDIGATEAVLDQIAEDALLSIQIKYNPRITSLSEIRQVLSEAY